jgi:hypothetical protein
MGKEDGIGLEFGAIPQNFTATLTAPSKFSKFYILFNETLTHPETNGSFSDLLFNVNVERSTIPLLNLVDFNWTVLNYTDKWIHVRLWFEEPYQVSEDDIVKVDFPDPRYFVAEGNKLLIRNLTLN